tara:strand:- start:998 stop:1345 length:348 start_codon:yes stop_codon:yes gene_type:complete
MKLSLLNILNETKETEYEYQVRNIGGDTFYKREKSTDDWTFTDETDFYKNSTSENTIEWNEPKKKKGEKIRQIEVNQDLDYKNNPLETYKRYLENVIPSNFSVDIVGNHIEIKEN